jgi:lysine 6-dehydrogenase
MRMLVLGAGLQGSACVYDLLQNPEVERVVAADVRTDTLPAFMAPHSGDRRLELHRVDARDADAVRGLMSGVDACLNALPFYFNLDITRHAIDAGVHCCDLGGNTAIVFEQLELDEAAKAADVSVVPDCGLAPGMVNILAALGIGSLDRAMSVKIRVGGLPQHPTPPLNYQIVYALEGVLDYYTTPSWVVRDGERQLVEALSEVEPIEFAEPVGTLEAFHTAGGLSTMPWTQKDVPFLEYKTLRYPGHAEIMRAIRSLGLLDNEPVTLRGGERVRPRDVFVACAEPRLRRPGGRDLVALRVIVEGEKDGDAKRIVYDLLDYFDEVTGVSAMERTTGYSLSITGQMQAQRQVAGPGVRTPDVAVPGDAYVAALAERGIRIASRVEAIELRETAGGR